MTDNTNNKNRNIEKYLHYGDVTLIARHFGLTRRAIYNQLRYKSNSVAAHNTRSFAVNLIQVRSEEVIKALPQLKEMVSEEYIGQNCLI